MRTAGRRPGGPLSLPPAASAASWKRSTLSRSRTRTRRARHRPGRAAPIPKSRPFASGRSRRASLELHRTGARTRAARAPPVEALAGLEVASRRGRRGRASSLPPPSVQSPRMILENGVVRTLDPSLPIARALAIAGAHVAGGVGTHETVASQPGGRRPRRTLRPSRVHRLARPLSHLVALAA